LPIFVIQQRAHLESSTGRFDHRGNMAHRGFERLFHAVDVQLNGIARLDLMEQVIGQEKPGQQWLITDQVNDPIAGGDLFMFMHVQRSDPASERRDDPTAGQLPPGRRQLSLRQGQFTLSFSEAGRLGGFGCFEFTAGCFEVPPGLGQLHFGGVGVGVKRLDGVKARPGSIDNRPRPSHSRLARDQLLDALLIGHRPVKPGLGRPNRRPGHRIIHGHQDIARLESLAEFEMDRRDTA
jgi:hypothetical protein